MPSGYGWGKSLGESVADPLSATYSARTGPMCALPEGHGLEGFLGEGEARNDDAHGENRHR